MLLLLKIAIFSLTTTSALAISCYECNSSSNFTCTEFWDASDDVNDQYFTNCTRTSNAGHCVKMTGVFDGKFGTKRFCSTRDWGNYCEYVDRPGDVQQYRSCVSTCSQDGCNGSHRLSSSLSSSLKFLTLSNVLLWLVKTHNL